ncbi:unnamed protein product [Phytophthora fragariaefolia]|uniref:Unnamed protein product n=1 Tax=Phytophthora fragariaefolia TaxID=1490495 RepID=A0A9W6YCM6_9STRA|nr:unnamed protein product [Phytophthora fragariaefolia]
MRPTNHQDSPAAQGLAAPSGQVISVEDDAASVHGAEYANQPPKHGSPEAWELAAFASTFEPETNNYSHKSFHESGVGRGVTGGNMVANAISHTDDKKCWGCNKPGHLKKNCPDRGGSDRAMFSLAIGQIGDDAWVLDSGASRHLVRDASILLDAVDCHDDCKIADGQSIAVTKKGPVLLRAVVDGHEHDVMVSDVYDAAELAQKLLSYCKLEEKDLVLVYENNRRYLQGSSDGAHAFEVNKLNDVLVVKTAASSTRAGRSSVVYAVLHGSEADQQSAIKCTLMELHARLGHLRYNTVESMADAHGSGIELTDRTRVNGLASAQGKQSKNVQSKKDSGKHSPIDRIRGVICSDLKGPMSPADREGNRCTVNFIDHNTNYCRIFVARKKGQAAKMFEQFLVYFERRFNCKVHVLRTDGGGEYRNVDLFCQSNGIVRQVSEAKNQASNVPPLEMLTGEKPQLADIVVFGSPCTAFRDPGKAAWKSRAEVGAIVGKNDETKGYKVYLPRDRVVIVTQHVQNIDTLHVADNTQVQPQLRREDPEFDRAPLEQEKTAQRKEQQGAIQPNKKKTRRGKRAGKKTTNLKNGQVTAETASSVAVTRADSAVTVPTARPGPSRMQTRNMGKKHVPVAMISTTPDPRDYKEAMRSALSRNWREAVVNEIKALEENGTWELVVKVPDAKLLHSKWVFKTKQHTDGTLERLKVRLVACGNEQEYGVDYTDTFSAALEMMSIKLLLALLRKLRVPAKHGDIPNAYVKADKERNMEILLHVPQGMEIDASTLGDLEVTNTSQVALRLHKSMYGLKQAGRLWARHLRDILLRLGFEQCYTDSCIYRKGSGADLTLVGVYVDDFLVTGSTEENVDKFFSDMAVLDVKNLSTVSKFLGMAITYDEKHGYLIEQHQAIHDFLLRFGLAEANSVRVPISDDQDVDVGDLLLGKGEGTAACPTVALFPSLVGTLLWIARCTRPDIAFAVHRVTRRTHAPREGDWRRAKRIARYLKGTIDLKFCMEGETSAAQEGVRLEGYSDADYAADRTDRKSVSGGMLRMDGMLLGLCELLGELGVPVQEPMTLHVDNQAAIKQIVGEDSSGKAKPIDVRHKFLKDFVKKGVITVEYCESRMMRVDLLTKAFPAPRRDELRGLASLK